MLDPEYLGSLPEPLLKLYDDLEDWIIRDIARRIKKTFDVTATAQHQTELLRALDYSQDEINQKIADTLNASKDIIADLYDEAMDRSSDFIDKRLPALKTDGSYKKELLDSAIKASEGDLTNLTRTAGTITQFGKYSPLTSVYKNTLSFAAMQVSSGATDYNTAIRNALKPFTDRGIISITYDKDGKIRKRSIEAAVRQCVMQGARDMSKAYMEDVAGDIGADGWEISAHLNCAPDHQDIQGRQYSEEKYQELNASLVRPIGTLNCRHMAFPIILGVNEPVHTQEDLENLKAQNNDGVTYEGRHYSLYEASQQQRKLERSIRKTKRQLIVADEVGDKDDFTAQSIRLRRLREYYNDFSNKCKLTKREDLLRIGKKNVKINKITNLRKAVDLFLEEENLDNSKITTKAILADLQTSQMGRDTIAYIEENNVIVHIIYEKPGHFYRGYQDKNEIFIFISNIKTTEVAAQTVVHEVGHIINGENQTQHAEAYCFGREVLHKRNQKELTKKDKEYVVKLARDNYSEYPWRKNNDK